MRHLANQLHVSLLIPNKTHGLVLPSWPCHMSIYPSPFSPHLLSPLNLPQLKSIYNSIITTSNPKLQHSHFVSSYLLAIPFSLPFANVDPLQVPRFRVDDCLSMPWCFKKCQKAFNVNSPTIVQPKHLDLVLWLCLHKCLELLELLEAIL